jgi:methylthioribose-1-phosphate isomerase
MPATFTTVMLTETDCQLLDQRQLPSILTYRSIASAPEMVEAISDMTVRGAPAIGIAAAYGVVLSARQALASGLGVEAFQQRVMDEAQQLRESRPTAVNLMWAIDRMNALLLKEINASSPLEVVVARLEAEARRIHHEDEVANKTMGELGAALMPANARIHTHCNAGALATGGIGTALGVIREAHAQGKCSMVYADETRPRQQGSKLTAWELMQDGISVTVVTDGMSGLMMRRGMVDAVITGADRIAANGDSANKIGTYNLALVAKAHNIPFYIAAPSSTFDPSLPTGEGIPIEERDGDEVRYSGESLTAPEGVAVFNPGFDVTPAHLITAIITEKGVFTPPYHFDEAFVTPLEAAQV